MELVREISDDEMIATFLRGEINSPRFHGRILDRLLEDVRPREIIDEPNLENRADNAYRRSLLGEARGYGLSRSLFNGFPADVRWYRARLTRSELASTKYLNYDYWVALSRGTRFVLDGAQSIRAGTTVFGVPNDGFFQVADALQGGARFPEPILVSVDESTLVVLEGHVRMTAYALAEEACPERIEVLVGFSESFVAWDKIDFS